MKKWKEIWIKIIVSFAILFVVFFSIDYHELIQLLININIEYILILLLLIPFSVFLRSWRWNYLFNFNNSNNTSLSFAVKLTLIGLGLNIFMPSQSGEIFKGYFGYRMSGIKERMFMISLYDKLIATSSVGLLGVIPSVYYSNVWFFIASLAAFLPLIIFILLIKKGQTSIKWQQRVNKILKGKIDLIRATLEIEAKGIPIVKTVLISILAWIFSYTIFWLCFKAMTPEAVPTPSIIYVFMLSPVITLARLFPFTLNGLGTDEALMIFLFSLINVTPEISFGAGLLFRALMIIIPGLIGLYFILSVKNETHISKNLINSTPDNNKFSLNVNN